MLKNKIIVANPVITDPVFAGKAIFMLSHSTKGAEGIILNPKEVGKVAFGDMQDIFNAAPGDFMVAKEMMMNGTLRSVPLFMGGPVYTPGLFFLHGYEQYTDILTADDQPEYDLGIPNSFSVNDEETEFEDQFEDYGKNKMKLIGGVYFGTPYTFGHIIEEGKLEEGKFRFYTGQSAWGPGQLESEFSQGAWSVLDCDVGDLFFDTTALNEEIASITNVVSNLQAKEEPKPLRSSWMPKMPPGYKAEWN